MRAQVDKKQGRSADKRWDWVRRGAPLILEIGPRDAANGQVTVIRRDQLRDGEKIKSTQMARADFVAQASALLQTIQSSLFTEAKARLDGAIKDDIANFEALKDYFGADESADFKGWARVSWCKPTGVELQAIADKLKAFKLTIRNAPMEQAKTPGPCIFSGAPGKEQIIVSRAY